MPSDGAIVFKTKIDNSSVQKDLDRVKRDIEKTTKSIAESETAKLPLLKDAERLKAKLEEARQELAFIKDEQAAAQSVLGGPNLEDHMEAYDRLPTIHAAVEEQEKKVADLEKEWSKVSSKVEQYDRKIDQAKISLEEQKNAAGKLSSQLSKGGINMSAAMEKAQKSANRFKKRLASIVSQAFVFTLVAKALRGITQYMGKALKSNKEFAAELSKLKGALLTAFQPIYEFLMPALMALMRIATSVVTAVARVASLLGGKSMSQYAKNAEALYNEANAIEETGEAAKKAQKSLAGFDEINQLGSNANNESNSNLVDPDFSWADNIDDMSANMENLLGIILSIAAGFIAWKIASSFLTDGKLAGGIGLIVAGLGLLAVGVLDVTKNGFKLENVLTIIAGLLAAGLGISLLTGSWIPVLIAAITSLLLSVVYFTGNGEELLEGLKQAFGGIYDFIAGAFTGDFDRALEGLKNIVKGFGTVFNVVFDSIEQYVGKFFAWLNEKTGGKFSSWIAMIQRSFSNLISGIRDVLNGLIDFVGGVFTGNWKKAWEGAKSALFGMWKAIANTIIGFVNMIIEAINSLFHIKFSGLSISGVQIIPKIDMKLLNIPPIPLLAQGAVLPANKPFLAMVGDQKHGTNIEAPLSTIQEAVAEVMADYEAANLAGHEATVETLRQILSAVLAIEVGDTTIGQAANRFNQKMAIIKGGL